ncbi:MAG: GtrA family protein [Candidatus Cloacimonetes bacterium]|nr:GtrA family protein [Candidatus Cloacimonadota bacterium]
MPRNFIKFVLRGVVGAVVDTSVLWILTTFFFHSYFTKYVLSPAISYELGIAVTYIICYFWIWNHRVHNEKSDFIKLFLHYNFVLLIFIVIKLGLLAVIYELFHFHIVICNVLALCFSGIVSFFASEKYIFVKKDKKYREKYCRRIKV